MENLNIVEIKSFVPAKDYALSKRFYEAIGFDMASDFGDVAYFSQGSCAFLLQNFYEPEPRQQLHDALARRRRRKLASALVQSGS